MLPDRLYWVPEIESDEANFAVDKPDRVLIKIDPIPHWFGSSEEM